MSLNISLTGGVALANTTPATVFTNVAGQVTRVTNITIAQGTAAVAKTVRVSIGADGVGTRTLEVTLAAGVSYQAFSPGWVLTGTQTIQLSATAGSNEAVCSINGYKDLVA